MRTKTAPAALLRKGTRLGKYRLSGRLGRGAFAEVWKARDQIENRPVALKIALPSVVEEWGREPIEHEARIASRLHHPGIVSVRNADWIDGRFVLVSELAVTHLGDYLRARRSAQVALSVIRQVAAGLAFAHSRRILHRDVKPENILIFADGRAALTDFGVSRFARGVTQTYTEAGTIGYMAPEQAYGRPRLSSDVFSLGLIAYEILTGVLPTWPFAWPPGEYKKFVSKVPEPLRPVLRKAQEFDPRRRYADAVELDAALAKVFRSLEASTERRTPRRRPRRRAAPSSLAVQAEIFRRHHGRRLEMRYCCSRCSGPISEAMAACPWCGETENSFREITTSALVCPECERGVRPEWTACPWCYKGRFQGNGRRPLADARAQRRCARRGCFGELRPWMRYCPMCKQKPRRAWTDPELPDRCPRCRWSVSREFWRFCPWCGRREPKAGSFVRRRRGASR